MPQQAGPLTPAIAPAEAFPHLYRQISPKPAPSSGRMIRRFAAKEDEMVRAIIGYSFQKSVRLEEIGPDNKPTGQVEIVTQQNIGSDGKLHEKPVRRAASTLHYLQLERGGRSI